MAGRRSWWRRGWWWKLPLVLAVLAVAFAPTLASPIVQRVVTSRLEEDLGGPASIDDLRLSWPLNLRARGVRVDDARRRPLLSLATLEASLEARELLSGRLGVDVRGTSAEVHVYQEPDGSWSFGKVPGARGEAPPPPAEEGRPRESEPAASSWRVHGGAWLGQSRVVLHANDGDLVLADVEAGGTLPREPSDATTFHLSFRAEGPEGPAGSLSSDGSLVLGPLERVDPREMSANLDVRGLTLAALRPVIARFLPERVPSGRIDATAELRGAADRVELQGNVTVDQLSMEIPAESAAAPLVLEEPRVSLVLQAELATGPLDLTLSRLQLDSGFAAGEISGKILNMRAWTDGAGSAAAFEGVHGDLTYVPDRIAALFGPLLPVELSGQERESLVLELDGTAARPDLETLLAGCRTTATLGLGEFKTTGVQGSGELELQTAEGGARWEARLVANGGKLDLSGDVDLPGDEISGLKLSVDAEDVSTNSELAPLLSLVHPAFAAVKTIQGAEIAGIVSCKLDLGYEGALKTETLAAGWEGFPKAGIQGSGRFQITGLSLSGSPAFAQMLGYLGIDSTKSLDVRPIEFTIAAGRLTYGRPWTWTIDGVETTFTGSVGLDQSLDLAWNVPVTAELAGKQHLLQTLVGQLVRLPITGTVKSPRLEWKDALSGLATETLREGVKDELLDALGVGKREGQDDPASLLAEADRLWDAGRKAEAAPIYARIHDEFKLSVVYALNYERIKKREKYRE